MHEHQERTPVVQNSPANAIARVQAGSGAIFGLFLILHLTTTMSGVVGAAAYDRTLTVLRNLYRPHLVIELLLIALSGTIHIGCALAQMAKRRKVFAVRGPWWMRAHRLSGYFLLATVVGHAVATRVLPAFGTSSGATGGADFAYLAYSVLGWPWFFWPYYLLLGTCGTIHLGVGVHLALHVLLPGRVQKSTPSRRHLLGVGAFALAVTVGIGGIITKAPTSSRERFTEYRSLYERFAPFVLRHRTDEPQALPPP